MTPPKKANVAGKRKGPARRKMAEEFPPGEVLTDTMQKSWKLGAPIGRGGFGLIYLADEASADHVGADDAPYAIKVEPSDNGPLFSELHFYMRAARPDLIRGWTKARKMKHLGVPKYWGTGFHQRGDNKYRFMVMDRCGSDLQKVEERSRFPRKLVLQLGLRLLDILEYVHEHDYVHADIKASNLLLGHRDPDRVYLVDYGLAHRYRLDGGVLKAYKEDRRKCHDGTIEFTSVDAHRGAPPARRGDVEIVAYCMVKWLCGCLPWSDRIRDPAYVRDAKIAAWANIPEFMSKCFSSYAREDKPVEIQQFMEAVKSLDYTDTPPYVKLRAILRSGLETIGARDDGKLEFETTVTADKSSPVARKTAASPSKARKATESPVRMSSAAVKRKKASDEDERPSEVDTSPMRKKMKAGRCQIGGGTC